MVDPVTWSQSLLVQLILKASTPTTVIALQQGKNIFRIAANLRTMIHMAGIYGV
jgi:hypothetical protein